MFVPRFASVRTCQSPAIRLQIRPARVAAAPKQSQQQTTKSKRDPVLVATELQALDQAFSTQMQEGKSAQELGNLLLSWEQRTGLFAPPKMRGLVLNAFMRNKQAQEAYAWYQKTSKRVEHPYLASTLAPVLGALRKHDEVLELYQRMKLNNITPPVLLVSQTIRSHLFKEQLQEALNVFNETLAVTGKEGYVQTGHRGLLFALLKAHREEDAFKVFEHLRQEPSFVNGFIFRRMLKVLTHKRRVNDALDLFEDAKAQKFPTVFVRTRDYVAFLQRLTGVPLESSPRLRQLLVEFAPTALQILGSISQQQLQHLFSKPVPAQKLEAEEKEKEEDEEKESEEESGPVPFVPRYLEQLEVIQLSAIVGLIAEGKLTEAEEVFRKIPDRVGYTSRALLNGFIKAGRIQEAERLLEEMKGPQHDAIANLLISAYGTSHQIGKAQELFDRLSKPSVASYVTLCHAYLDNNNTEKALEIYEMTKEKAFALRFPIFLSLITALWRAGSQEKAKELFRDMRKNKLYVPSNQMTPEFHEVMQSFAPKQR